MYEHDDIFNNINNLFLKAHEINEFEFCCVLLRVSGIKSPGWDALIESKYFISETLKMLESNISSDYKYRLLLMLYCHVTEMDDLYNVIANLLRIVLGMDYSCSPFEDIEYPDKKKAIYPVGKVKRIVKIAAKSDFEIVGEYFTHILDNNIRNAFYHSDYTFYKDHFRIIKGDGVTIDRIVTNDVKLSWLVPKIEMAINIAVMVLDLMMYYRKQYLVEEKIFTKIVDSNEPVEITLLVNEGGLAGFKI